MTTAAIARPAFSPFDTEVDVTNRLDEFNSVQRRLTLIHADGESFRNPKSSQADPPPGPPGRIPWNGVQICIGVDPRDQVSMFHL